MAGPLLTGTQIDNIKVCICRNCFCCERKLVKDKKGNIIGENCNGCGFAETDSWNCIENCVVSKT